MNYLQWTQSSLLEPRDTTSPHLSVITDFHNIAYFNCVVNKSPNKTPKMFSRWTTALSTLVAIAAPVNAFVSPGLSPIVTPTFKSSSLNMGPPIDPSAPYTEKVGEGSRKYRRTVYTHDQWVKHRSPDRFLNNLKTLFNSGIYQQVANEIAATVGVATFVCVWNSLVGGYQGLDGAMNDPVIQASWAQVVGLPMTVFTILNSSLGLLLGEL